MRHIYHVPAQADPPAAGAEAETEVTRAVRAAVLRGVARAVRDLAGDEAETAGEAVPLVRPSARWRAGPDGEEQEAEPGARRYIALPSYQDRGRPVGVPVSGPGGAVPAGAPGASRAAAHPMVTAVNEVAAQVRQAEQVPPPPVVSAPPVEAGIFGRMWARGAAEDTRRLLRPSRADLEQAEERLIRVVSAEALRMARVLLDRNEVVARWEAARYVDPSAAKRLRGAATEMAALQRKILDRVRDVGNAAMAGIPGAPVAGAPLDLSHFDDILTGAIARGDAQVQRDLLPRLNALKRIYGPEFPVLLGRNMDYAQFTAPDPQLLTAVGDTTSDVLQNIGRLRSRLTEESVWQLAPVLEAARHLLVVVPGTPAAQALDRYLAQRKQDEVVRQLMLAALGITLSIAATVATAGAAAPAAGAGLAALAGGASLATAGVSVFGAVEHYESYTFEHAAARSSLDPATLLTRMDPSIAWLAVSVLGAVVDVGSAVVAVRNLAQLAKLTTAARDLVALEQAARAQAKVLAVEGRLATTEQQFVDGVMAAARRRIGGAATVLRYGSHTFRPNPDGARSLAEAVHLARKWGVHIEEDILLGLDATLGRDKFARYSRVFASTEEITWEKLTGKIKAPTRGQRPTYWTAEPIEDEATVMIVRLRPDVLESDEAIVAVLAHEMHEVNFLRARLKDGGPMSATEFYRLVNGENGTEHLEAWRIGLALVDRMRAGAP